MDIKETENLIEQTLNSQKPNKSVLSAAKEAMAKNKPHRMKKLWSYALSSCAACLLVIAGTIIAILNPIRGAAGFPESSNPKNPDATPLNEILWANGLLAAILIALGIGIIITFIIFKVKKKRNSDNLLKIK